MIEAVITQIEMSEDRTNVDVTVDYLDDNGDNLILKPAVFQMGLEEFQIAGNLDELIRARARQIQDDIDAKAATEVKGAAFERDVLSKLRDELEGRHFDVTDTTISPVKLDFTEDQLLVKENVRQVRANASAQLDSKANI